MAGGGGVGAMKGKSLLELGMLGIFMVGNSFAWNTELSSFSYVPGSIVFATCEWMTH